MKPLPDRQQQIVRTHAGLIQRVVLACSTPEQVTDLEAALKASEANGWTALVNAIRRILEGSRDEALLRPLDDEDRTIVSAILRGLQDPSTLPTTAPDSDASHAAPGLAALIHAAGSGDSQALSVIASMADQMSQVGGDMARLAALIKPLIDGERDADRLCAGMGPMGQGLVQSILSELARLNPQ